MNALLSYVDKVILDTEDKWGQGRYAQTFGGRRVDVDSPDADKWCLSGACWKAQKDMKLGDEYFQESVGLLRSVMPSPSSLHGIAHFNDTHTYADVKELIQKAQQVSDITGGKH